MFLIQLCWCPPHEHEMFQNERWQNVHHTTNFLSPLINEGMVKVHSNEKHMHLSFDKYFFRRGI